MPKREEILGLSTRLHCSYRDLIVEEPQNDPFYAGGKSDTLKAQWFASMWSRFGYSTGVHLRRVHYRLIGQELLKHDGLVYENTDNDWNYLLQGGSQARYLGLVDPEAFVDRRNPEPKISVFSREYSKPSWEEDYLYEWRLPWLDTDLAPHWELPSYTISGYDYGNDLQPYHLEIWCEKSTQDDILIPICRQYGVNLVTGIGFLSITSVINLLRRRVRQIGKPVRIFYISDFDPQGKNMPPSIGRQIEFWLEFYGMSDEVKLTPLVLNEEQVRRYRLPRSPIKEENKGRTNFEKKYGEGATELDALEALYPGELRRIVEEAIDDYYDYKLAAEVASTECALNNQLREAFHVATEPYNDRLGELREAVEEVIAEYTPQIEELADELNEALAPYQAELESIQQGIKERIDGIDVEALPLPLPNVNVEDDGWLFDSNRTYFDQLRVYKQFQKKFKDFMANWE